MGIWHQDELEARNIRDEKASWRDTIVPLGILVSLCFLSAAAAFLSPPV
jgi:hypothetical protein